MGVLIALLGFLSMGIRVYTGRFGTTPECVLMVALVSLGACLTAWLVWDGPLYREVKVGLGCTDAILETTALM